VREVADHVELAELREPELIAQELGGKVGGGVLAGVWRGQQVADATGVAQF
jgi:hypothetical protein